MSDAELPQPIYPSAGGAVPPAGVGVGYGSGPVPGGPGGGSGGGSGVDPKVLIGIVAAAVVIIAVVVFAMTRSDGDKDAELADTTIVDSSGNTSTERPGTTDDETTRPSRTDPVDTGPTQRERAETVAANQVQAASADTVVCMADEFEANPTLLDTIEPMADAVSFDDPGLADEFGRIVASCATTDELLIEFENLFAAEGLQGSDLGCLMDNLSLFGAPQWQDFIATVLQPSEASYAQELIVELATC